MLQSGSLMTKKPDAIRVQTKTKVCGSGGIGRRTSLRGWRGLPRDGSSPFYRTKDQLNRIWYGYHNHQPQHYDNSRYHGVNLHNVWYRGTVEFRWFEATLHAGRIKAYLQFCLAVAAKALNGRAASSRKRDFDPQSAKYDFRVFLLHLGLIGDEFKTARKHLMANMPGDAAFKNGRPKPQDVLPDETTTTLTNEAGQVPGLTV